MKKVIAALAVTLISSLAHADCYRISKTNPETNNGEEVRTDIGCREGYTLVNLACNIVDGFGYFESQILSISSGRCISYISDESTTEINENGDIIEQDPIYDGRARAQGICCQMGVK